MAKFIGILSGKGGVGRTTIALNTSLALHYFGREVILVDAHLTSPNVALYLGAHQCVKTIHHALINKENILDCAYLHKSGLKIIPGCLDIPHVEKALENLDNLKDLTNELNPVSEAVILDLPAYDTNLHIFLRLLDYAIIVVTPDMLSITEAIKTIEHCKEEKVKIAGIVINMKKGKEFEVSSNSIQKLLGYKLLGEVDYNEKFLSCVKCKDPLQVIHPHCKEADEFKKIARYLIGE